MKTLPGLANENETFRSQSNRIISSVKTLGWDRSRYAHDMRSSTSLSERVRKEAGALRDRLSELEAETRERET